MYVNFNEGEAEVKRLEEISEELKRISHNNLRECFGGIENAWQGENALKYRKKGNQLSDNITHTAERFDEIAQSIKKILVAAQKAEENAAQIARRR